MVAACGVPSRDVTIRYNAPLQEEVIHLRAPDLLPPGRLACVAEAAMQANRDLAFSRSDQQAIYDRTYLGLQSGQVHVEARQALAAREMPEIPPLYDPAAETLAAFAIRMERFCGTAPKTSLTADASASTIGTRDDVVLTSEQRDCLLTALAASNLDERGVTYFEGRNATSPRH